MTNTIPKRGDVFFCQGSPDAIGSEERKTRPVVIIQNDAGNASSPTVIVANMTTNTSRRLYPMQFDIDLPGHSPSRVRTSGYEGHAERGDAVSRSEEAVKKWAEALDIPEDQALPCVVAFACLRYHGKSFVRKLANGTGPITTWQSLKIGVALFLWGRAQKKDPWGELYRITKFAQAWKEGDSI